MSLSDKKHCIICEKKIENNDGRRIVTCSRNCGRVYSRLYNYIRARIFRDSPKYVEELIQ